MKNTTYCKLCGRLRDAFACQDCYDKDTEELQAINDSLLAALELCQTRIFNYMSGMDENRRPDATEELNDEAFLAARDAIKKATHV